MNGLSTHVLDTSTGRPAGGVSVTLWKQTGGADAWTRTGGAATDSDGRVRELVPAGSLGAGMYRLRFEIGAYFAASGTPCFYPYADVVFTIAEPSRHHHVPLLASPFGYSTYRGS